MPECVYRLAQLHVDSISKEYGQKRYNLPSSLRALLSTRFASITSGQDKAHIGCDC
jgi:hypothetical protein